MNAMFSAVAVLALLGVAAAQTPASLAPQSTSASGQKYWKDPLVAAKANNLTAFASTAESAGLGPTLGVADLVATIFAPSNAAFEAFKKSTDPVVQAILDDKAKLVEVLKYHVVPGATIGSARIKSMINGTKTGELPYKTLEGEKVVAKVAGGKTVTINDVAIVGTDVQGGKTMVHTIDDVLIPPTLLSGGSAAPATTGAPAASTPAPANSAATVAAGLLLAVPAALAALL